MSRTRIAVIGVSTIALLIGLYLAVPVLRLEIGDPSVPPVSAIAELPDGAQVTEISQQCGPDACWLVVSVLAVPGTSGQELADTVTPNNEHCERQSTFDLRQVCTVPQEIGPTDVRFGVIYERYL